MSQTGFVIFHKIIHIGTIEKVSDTTVNLSPLPKDDFQAFKQFAILKVNGLQNVPVEKVGTTEAQAWAIYEQDVKDYQQSIVDKLSSFKTPKEAVSYIMTLNLSQVDGSTTDIDAIHDYLALPDGNTPTQEEQIINDALIQVFLGNVD